jgi:hypothetical protein
VKITKDPRTREELIARLDKIIAEYEREHGMNTDTLLESLKTGKIQETLEHVSWLMDVYLRGRLLGMDNDTDQTR